MASVELTGVTKLFGEYAAVDDVSLRIEDGSFTVLVGPSGCGKTTTLRMVAGLEELTAGQIRIGDQDVSDTPPANRDIAMVFQNYALYPHMTVRDNMGFGLKLRKTPRPEITRRIDEVAEMLGLGDLLDRKPRQLSGGQRQRVALGRAIARRPAVFLMDEPLSNLDAKLRAQTRAELVRIHRELGATFIYVTHDQVEAMTMGQQAVVMDSGRVQQAASPRDVYLYPQNIFVAGFVGSPPMNLVKVGVSTNGDGRAVLDLGADDRVHVSRELSEQLRPHVGDSVTFGVRPEHIKLSADSEGLRYHVEMVELLGHDTLLHLSGVGAPLLARVDSRYAPSPGEELRVDFDYDHVSVFHPDTGLSIRSDAPPLIAAGSTEPEGTLTATSPGSNRTVLYAIDSATGTTLVTRP
ncbi:MAG: ABC transporter ATP-binding protein [Coriobacteriia bacterium]|nr:ABC transporter ATP-binding protein [Coriobacteriia bacterium]